MKGTKKFVQALQLLLMETWAGPGLDFFLTLSGLGKQGLERWGVPDMTFKLSTFFTRNWDTSVLWARIWKYVFFLVEMVRWSFQLMSSILAIFDRFYQIEVVSNSDFFEQSYFDTFQVCCNKTMNLLAVQRWKTLKSDPKKSLWSYPFFYYTTLLGVLL